MSKKSNRKKQLEKKAKELKKLKKEESHSQSKADSDTEAGPEPTSSIIVDHKHEVEVLDSSDDTNTKKSRTKISMIVTPIKLRFELGSEIPLLPSLQFRNLKIEYKGKFCDGCFKSLLLVPLKPCSGCHVNFYCSKECHVQDWKVGHKLECRSEFWKECMQKSGTRVQSSMLNQDSWKARLFRAHSFVKLDPKHGRATEPFQLLDEQGNGTQTSFKYLLDSYSKIQLKTLPIQMPTVREFKEFAKQWAKEDKDKDIHFEYIVRLYRFLDRHSMSILADGTGTEIADKKVDIGYGTYAQMTSVSPACRGNISVWIRPGTGTLVARAITDIYEGDSLVCLLFSEIEPKLMRQQRLKEKGILTEDCDCNLCSSLEDCFFQYKRLTALWKEYKCLIRTPPLEDPWNWTGILDLHIRIIEMLQSIFFKFDPRIGDLYNSTIQVGQAKQVDWESMLDLMCLAKQHFIICYGSDHYYVESLDKMFASRLKYQSKFKNMSLKHWLVTLIDEMPKAETLNKNAEAKTKTQDLNVADSDCQGESVPGPSSSNVLSCTNGLQIMQSENQAEEQPEVRVYGDYEPGAVIQLRYGDTGEVVNYLLEEPQDIELEKLLKEGEEEHRKLSISQLSGVGTIAKGAGPGPGVGEDVPVAITQCQLIGFGPRPDKSIQMYELMEIDEEDSDNHKSG